MNNLSIHILMHCFNLVVKMLIIYTVHLPNHQKAHSVISVRYLDR